MRTLPSHQPEGAERSARPRGEARGPCPGAADPGTHSTAAGASAVRGGTCSIGFREDEHGQRESGRKSQVP